MDIILYSAQKTGRMMWLLVNRRHRYRLKRKHNTIDALVPAARDAFQNGTPSEARIAINAARMKLRLKPHIGTDETQTITSPTSEAIMSMERTSEEVLEELQTITSENPGQYEILAYGPHPSQTRETGINAGIKAVDLLTELFDGDWGGDAQTKARIVHPATIDRGDGAGAVNNTPYPMSFNGDEESRAACNARLAE